MAGGDERPHEEVCSPSQNQHQTALSSGGESAPLIRVRSVVRVHEGPPFDQSRRVEWCRERAERVEGQGTDTQRSRPPLGGPILLRLSFYASPWFLSPNGGVVNGQGFQNPR